MLCSQKPTVLGGFTEAQLYKDGASVLWFIGWQSLCIKGDELVRKVRKNLVGPFLYSAESICYPSSESTVFHITRNVNVSGGQREWQSLQNFSYSDFAWSWKRFQNKPSLNEEEALCVVSRCVQKSGLESTDEEIMIWFCLFKSLSELPQRTSCKILLAK